MAKTRAIVHGVVWQFTGANLKDDMDKILQTFRRGPSRAEGEQKLLEIARELGGINDLLLKQCIDTRCNRDLLQRNLDWARQRMGQEYVLPALYKDGQRISYEELVEVMK